MPEDAESPKPIPLWAALYATIIALIPSGGIYSSTAKTNRHGWLATFSALLELSGVLLIASPELRPRVERALVFLRNAAKRGFEALVTCVQRLLGRRHAAIKAGASVATAASLGVKVHRAFEDPPAVDADIEEKVEYLLRQDQRFKDLFNLIEAQTRSQVEQLRGELERMATDLSRQTAESVRQLAESELRMRLLGVVYVVAGLILGYTTNLS